MKALTRLRMKRIFEGPAVAGREAHALLWAETSADMARELMAYWEERIVAPVADLLVLLANTADDQIAEFRKLASIYDIANESDAEVRVFRDELRTVWIEIEKERGVAGEIAVPGRGDQVKVYGTLHKWWRRYPLDSDGWRIFWETRIFLPTQKNFRAIAGQILYAKSHLLGRCLNPVCQQFFLKRRTDQKFCLEKGCLRFGNRERVKKHKKARKSGGVAKP